MAKGKVLWLSAIAAGVLLFSGCDSKSSSSGESVESMLATKTTLTEENAPDATLATLEAVGTGQETVGEFGQVINGMEVLSAASQAQFTKPVSAISTAVFALGLLDRDRSVSATESMDCPEGGSVSATETEDTLSITFSSCNMGDGEVVSGTATISDFDWATEGGYDLSFSATLDVSHANSAAGESGTVKGSFKAAVNLDGSENMTKLKIENMSVVGTYQEEGWSDVFAVKNYRQLVDTIGDTMTVEGEVGYKYTTGGVTKQFAVTIDGNAAGLESGSLDYPETGTLTLTGADDTEVVVVFSGNDAYPDVTVTLNDMQIFPVSPSVGTYAEFDDWGSEGE